MLNKLALLTIFAVYLIKSKEINEPKQPKRWNNFTPSLFQVCASQIANKLFPINFAKFQFLPQQVYEEYWNGPIAVNYNEFQQVSCYQEGHVEKYKRQNNINTTIELEGVQNIFATAFTLGLQVKYAIQTCIKYNGKIHIFVHDFTNAFFKVYKQYKILWTQYRTHKIPEEIHMGLWPGWLFPRSFIDQQKCGSWLAHPYRCSVQKLKQAYHRICGSDINQMISSITRNELIYTKNTNLKERYPLNYRMNFFRSRLQTNFQVVCQLLQQYQNDQKQRIILKQQSKVDQNNSEEALL